MIGELISDYAVSVTLRRRGTGTAVKGRVTQPAPTTSTISVAVVPATGKDLLRLPEGSRTLEVKRVFSEVTLLVEPNPDEIVYRGVVYEVKACADWEDQGGFFDSLMIKKESQA